MKLTNPELIVKRSYKEVYKDGDKIVKIFEKDHPKSAVFNEALNTVRVEEAGLDIPKLDEVTQIDEKWALVIECQAGETLETVMEKDPDNLEKYMAEFVDLQLQIHAKTAPMLTKLKDKLAKQINQLKELDATQRYELLVRLESMPKHTKVCHGDFNPSNVIVGEDGKLTVVDWAHVTQGNASADAALTYLQFALKNRVAAEMYLTMFCKKSDTAKQYVQQWFPIVAAAQLEKNNELEKHVPVYTVDKQHVHVVVGETKHPMLEAHFIEWITLNTNQGIYRKQLNPGQEPVADFSLCDGEQVEEVYAYCNLHGLWKC